jgi:DNA sulfur modification protein DndE
MKPPVEHVRVSAKGKEMLIKIKRNTGLEHWTEICRIALCWSLTNPTPPPKQDKPGDSVIDIEWKTFAGAYQEELAALTILRANNDGIDLSRKDALADYFRSHIERGIASLQHVRNLSSLCTFDNH